MGKVIIVQGTNDLATTHPNLAKEWDTQLNSKLPNEVFGGSNQKAFWRCHLGHSFEASLTQRTRLNTGCPFCKNTRVLQGFNDLATKASHLASEFDLDKNYPATPSTVSPATEKKYFWICPKKHSYFTSVKSRFVLGTGCPVCANLVVQEGENDLASQHPQIAETWDYSKNSGLKPSQVIPGSPKKHWWICAKQHSYQASAADRVSGNNCSVCAGKVIIPGSNDLATTNPLIAQEFDLIKNYPLKPTDFLEGSNKKFHWKCKYGHEWLTSAANRKTTGCPTCSNRKLLTGFNDLKTKNPTLASEWNFDRNAPLLPDQITAGSGKKVWWKCSKDSRHEWINSPSARSRDQGCPVCHNVVVISGVNDLETINPDVASEWDFEQNYPVLPSQIAAGTSKKFWWKCQIDPTHIWRTTCDSRLSGKGCPSCSKTGYDPNRVGVFYFIENKTLLARKVGITNSDRKSSRLDHFKDDGWQIIATFENNDGTLIQTLETIMLRWIRKDCGLPQHLGKQDMGRTGGYSETFSMDGVSNNEVIHKIESTFGELTKS